MYLSCCIDKMNLVELSEAINSMFRWYHEAAVCYAYLTDVKDISQLSTSRWFTRGWTLQELIAPKYVVFYSAGWQYLGNRLQLSKHLSAITNIEPEVLSTGEIEQISTQRRMCWAANRKTTRVEDATYCLMGIFNVNMPLLYGEGTKAFLRLQEAIMKISDDPTIFAWNLPPSFITYWDPARNFIMLGSRHQNTLASGALNDSMSGLLANSPLQFLSLHRIRPLSPFPLTPATAISNGVQIELPVISYDGLQFAVLPATIDGFLEHYLGFLLRRWDDRWNGRVGELVLIASSLVMTEQSRVIYIKKPIPRPCMLLSPLFQVEVGTRYEGVSESMLKPRLHLESRGMHPCDNAKIYDEDTLEVLERWDGPFGVYFIQLETSTTGPNPIFGTRFAVVVGHTIDTTNLSRPRDPWFALVPILQDDHPDIDFRAWSGFDPKLIRYCMTESQLKERLHSFDEKKMPFLDAKRSHIELYLDRRMMEKDLEMEHSDHSTILDISFNIVAKNLVERKTMIKVILRESAFRYIDF